MRHSSITFERRRLVLNRIKNPRRQFYALIAIFLIAIGMWNILKDRFLQAQIFFGAGAFVLALEFLFTKTATLLFAFWMKFAVLFGKVNTVIILSIVYFTVMVPIALFARSGEAKSPDSDRNCRKRRSSWFGIEPSKNYYDPY